MLSNFEGFHGLVRLLLMFKRINELLLILDS